MVSGLPGRSACLRRQSSSSLAISGWTRTALDLKRNGPSSGVKLRPSLGAVPNGRERHEADVGLRSAAANKFRVTSGMFWICEWPNSASTVAGG
jgi:hypothetical protein